jgi:hypothetical protein
MSAVYGGKGISRTGLSLMARRLLAFENLK